MENEQEQKQEQDLMSKLKKLVEDELEQLVEVGLQDSNIDNFGKLIDVHKDIENENYWKVKKEVMTMRYNDYGDYNDGGYFDGGNYGRRGVPGSGRGRYRAGGRGGYSGPEQKLEEMMEQYGNYSEASEAMQRGNYGAEEDTMKSLDYMLKSVCHFLKMLEQGAGSQEEMQLIKKYARKIGEM